MSEKLPLSSHEKDPLSHQEKIDLSKEAEAKSKEKAEKASHEHAEKLDEIRDTIEKEASHKEKNESGNDVLNKGEKENSHDTYVGQDVKKEAYKRTLRRTQQKLSPPMRTLSKVIHNPVVESVSEITGKTIARPSGILVGGIVASLGSTVFLWTARHYGYEYNFLLFALLFVCGFCIGLLVEMIIRLLRIKK